MGAANKVSGNKITGVNPEENKSEGKKKKKKSPKSWENKVKSEMFS